MTTFALRSAAAIDLPGYGRSKEARAQPGEFLVEFLPALDIGRPVVVSPSMSGSFSFPLVLEHPERSSSCSIPGLSPTRRGREP